MPEQLDVFSQSDIQAATASCTQEQHDLDLFKIPDWAKDDPTLELGVTPGCFSVVMSNSDYHAKSDYLSHTGMISLLQSPKHYLAYLRKNGNATAGVDGTDGGDESNGLVEEDPKEKEKEKEKINIFNVFHSAVLEPESYDDRYVVYDGGRRQGKKWDEFYQIHTVEQGKTILTKKEDARAKQLVKAVKEFADFDLWALLCSNQNEKSIFWFDKELGVYLRIRVDSLHKLAILDLKGIDDARAPSARKAIGRGDYDLQAALYTRGVEQFVGERLPFNFIFCESNDPFGIWIHGAGQSLFTNGLAKVRKACATFRRAQATGDWHGYKNAHSVIEMSRWDMLAPELLDGEY